jgi:hypothetical protein
MIFARNRPEVYETVEPAIRISFVTVLLHLVLHIRPFLLRCVGKPHSAERDVSPFVGVTDTEGKFFH